jgi:hypothetical protein
MKYNLRFGIMTNDGWRSFATINSQHLPKQSELIYLGDETIKDTNWNLGIELSTTYRVLQSVVCFNNYNEEDDCSSVEITVEATDI